MKIISWNTRHRPEIWREVANLSADVALLQEASEPPLDLLGRFEIEPEPWRTEAIARRPWRTSVVGLKEGLRMTRLRPEIPGRAGPDDFAVSRLGTITYLPSTTQGNWIFAGASAHRLISDISSLVGRKQGHRIIAAGDLNCLYGYGEYGNDYWARRYQTISSVWQRLDRRLWGHKRPTGVISHAAGGFCFCVERFGSPSADARPERDQGVGAQ